jgi:N-acetylglucosamine-6-sulfatase
VKTLRRAGYQTGLFGKYFNDYGAFCGKNIHVPSDWSFVHLMCDDNLYFGNTFNVNGTEQTVSKNTYLTNVIGNASLTWLDTVTSGSAPFFAYIAPHAPHVPATPAHEYENTPIPLGELAPRTPNWNYATAHHHWLVSQKVPMTPGLIKFSDELFARRMRSTISVDDILQDVFALLRRKNLLESTYIIFTSDHGAFSVPHAFGRKCAHSFSRHFFPFRL